MTTRRTVLVGAALALVVGLPGAATAVATIRSVDIVDGQVKNQDLANGAVSSNKVRTDALTGQDIDESTLGRVPDAARVGGLEVAKVFVDDHESNSGELLSMADLRIRYSCNNPGELYVYARVLAGSSGEFTYTTYAGGPSGIAGAGDEVEIASIALGNIAIGHLQYFDPAGHVVTFDWTIKSLDTCLFVGTAVGG